MKMVVNVFIDVINIYSFVRKVKKSLFRVFYYVVKAFSSNPYPAHIYKAIHT